MTTAVAGSTPFNPSGPIAETAIRIKNDFQGSGDDDEDKKSPRHVLDANKVDKFLTGTYEEVGELIECEDTAFHMHQAVVSYYNNEYGSESTRYANLIDGVASQKMKWGMFLTLHPDVVTDPILDDYGRKKPFNLK